MAVISNVWFKRDTILNLAKALTNNPEKKGIGVDVFHQDETNEYGQNVSLALSQTKEEREAKKKRYYIANGEVKWMNDKGATKPEKKEAAMGDMQPVKAGGLGNAKDDDLPF